MTGLGATRVAAMLVVVSSSFAVGQPSRVRMMVLPPPNATLGAEFGQVGSVRELADGSVLVIDRSEQTIVLGEWSKGPVTTIGRHGSGPGEYLVPMRLLGAGGDSTIVPDSRNGRWLVLRGKSIVGTVGPGEPAIGNGNRLPLGADTMGRVIATRGRGGSTATEVPRLDSLLLVRVAVATGKTDTVAMLRARPATIKVEGPSDKPTSVSVTINPLAAGEQAAPFPDGWIAIARIEPYRVEWRAADGRRIAGEPLPFESVRVDERERRAFLQRLAARTGQDPLDPARFPEWPQVMPPFTPDALLVAPDGRLWVRRPPTAANPATRYDIVDRLGRLVARLTTEPNVEIIGFGRQAVYSVRTDDDGIQRIQRHSLPAI